MKNDVWYSCFYGKTSFWDKYVKNGVNYLQVTKKLYIIKVTLLERKKETSGFVSKVFSELGIFKCPIIILIRLITYSSRD